MYERTSRMNTLYSWEMDSLEGPHDVKATEQSALKRGKNFVRRDWTWKPKERVRSKVTPRNLGVELNVRGGASQRELRLKWGLMGIRTEEATFTYIGVDWEAPFQRPFFKVIEGLLNRVGSFQRVRGESPYGEIISIEWVFSPMSEVVGIQDKEGWTKDGALRDSASDSNRAASSTTEEDLYPSVWQKGSGLANKAGRKT